MHNEKNCCGGEGEHGNCCGKGMMKYHGKGKCVKIFMVIFLVSISLASLSWAWATMQKVGTPIAGAPRLSVSAEGKVTVKPDLVKVNFSVVSQGDDYVAVQKDSDAKMAKAIDYLKEIEIAEDDIKTIAYNLTPNYDYDWCREAREIYRPCPPKIVSYSLRQRVEVKIRDIAKTGEILSNLPEKGVNEIYSPVFTIDDPEQFKTEARNIALTKAKEKAKMIAKASGISLGKVIEFSEGGYAPSPRFDYALSAKEGIGGGGDSFSPIESGSQDVTVTISLSYEIK